MTIQDLVDHLRLANFPVDFIFERVNSEYLRITMSIIDRDSGQPDSLTRYVAPSDFSDVQGTLDQVRAELRGMLLHELDEAFHFRGKRVFEPHPAVVVPVFRTDGYS